MISSLAHRGPDDQRIWTAPAIGLAHCMLRTTPESVSEKQPYEAGGHLTVTADARLDNRDELFSTLSIREPRSSVPDSELIVRAYAAWGEECPKHLVGDFAFAIWDARSRRLFCARDAAGVRPFYYYASSTLFAFASEIKALLTFSEVPRRLNERRVAAYLLDELGEKTGTFYRDIARLPAAHRMTVEQDRLRSQSYWSTESSRAVRYRSSEEYAEAYLHHFREAVRCRLRSVHPVGSTLSGGLDSSSVSCVARDILAVQERLPLPIFTAVYPPSMPGCHERAYAEAVLRQEGFEEHAVDPLPIDALGDLVAEPLRLDEPPAYFTWAMEKAVFEEAKRQGVRVLLTGGGGDHLSPFLSQYPVDLLLGGRWMRLASELRALAEEQSSSARHLLWRRAVRPVLRHAVLTVAPGLRGSSADLLPSFLNPDFVRRLDLQAYVRERQHELEARTLTAQAQRHSMFSDGFTQYALDVSDQLAIAYGCRMRHPFWDRRLMDFVSGLPTDQLMQRGTSRVLHRRAMAGIIPEVVRTRRSKAAFNHLAHHGLVRHNREMLQDLIAGGLSVLEPYVKVGALREQYAQYLERSASEVPPFSMTRTIATTALLAHWLKQRGPAVLQNRVE